MKNGREVPQLACGCSPFVSPLLWRPVNGFGAAGEPGDLFDTAAEAGIHRLAIPTPFAVGRVNVYLIEDEPLTLVDAGPNSGTSLDQLQRGSQCLDTRSRTSGS